MPAAAGRDLADVARELNLSIDEAIERLHPAGANLFHHGRIRCPAHPRLARRDDRVRQHSGGHAPTSPRLGRVPASLGRYSRDLGLFSLEEAVRRMTSLPAERFGLADRGTLKLGAYADVVVFDPITVADRATYEEPEQPAAGIALVLVNGRAVWSGGEHTRALARVERCDVQEMEDCDESVTPGRAGHAPF